MRLLIFNILTLLLFTTKSFGDPKEELEQRLLLLEQKIFLCQSDTEKAPLCFEKMQLHITATDYEAALKEAKRIDYTVVNDSSVRQRFLWNAALLAYLNSDLNYAAHYYNRYRQLYVDSSIQSILLEVMIEGQKDSVSLNAPVAYLAKFDTRFNSLLCLKEASAYSRKNENLYVVASAIVPGSGSMLNGDVLKGTNSLLLNAASVAGVALLVKHHLYANAVIWGTMVGLKFYIGNILLTQSLFEQKELRIKSKLANNCELTIKDVLEDYPLNFK